MSLLGTLTQPLFISSVELLHCPPIHAVRVRAEDGQEGLAITNQWAPIAGPIVKQLLAPRTIGSDARDWPATHDALYRANYKVAGLLYWSASAWVEFAVLDLLAKAQGVSVARLLGRPVRKQVPVYLSRMSRQTTPEEELAFVEPRLAETGAKALKVKIGGRMSGNADASPGRSERLVKLLRDKLPREVAIYVDANGSYDAATGIEVGRMLEANGVAMYEEPCPFEDIESTRRVAEALAIPIAGGEQDSSLSRFGEILRGRCVDVLQPDVHYCGGILRAMAIAEMARPFGVPIVPHSPKSDAVAGPLLQLLALLENVGPFHEWHAEPSKATWYEPRLKIVDGAVAIPDGPGLGLEIDPEFLGRAVAV